VKQIFHTSAVSWLFLKLIRQPETISCQIFQTSIQSLLFNILRIYISGSNPGSRDRWAGFPLKFWKHRNCRIGGLCHVGPVVILHSAKGRALIAAIKVGGLPRTCDAYFAFFIGFLAGGSFCLLVAFGVITILWLQCMQMNYSCTCSCCF